VETALKDQHARALIQVEAKTKADIERAKKDAAKTAEQQIKAFKASQEAAIHQRVQAARESFEKKLADAVNAEKTKSFQEKLRLNEQLSDMQRRLEKKTADELGEGAEVDLFESLTQEFRADKIIRVARGQNGADVIHDVIHDGSFVGRIIYDSKNHKRWQNKFTAKLRQDMNDHNADHGVLSSSVFPSGARQLHIQDSVIVANPVRVVVLARMLRRHVIQVHFLRLGNEARIEKTAQLYDFVTSSAAPNFSINLGRLPTT